MKDLRNRIAGELFSCVKATMDYEKCPIYKRKVEVKE